MKILGSLDKALEKLGTKHVKILFSIDAYDFEDLFAFINVNYFFCRAGDRPELKQTLNEVYAKQFIFFKEALHTSKQLGVEVLQTLYLVQWNQDPLSKLYVLFFQGSGESAHYGAKNFKQFCEPIMLLLLISNKQKKVHYLRANVRSEIHVFAVNTVENSL